MTSVSATPYTASYASILASAQRHAQQNTPTAATGPSDPGATTKTFSDAAKAALEGKDFATVTADARFTMTKLLADAKLQSPLKDGALAIDMSKVDRRELFAMSTNAEQKFNADEQKAASLELQRRFDSALAGPAAVARVTGDIKGLYSAALEALNAMSGEEKASASWADAKAAVEDGLKQLASDPRSMPRTAAADPVAAYLKRVETGEAGKLREFSAVAKDVRTALDKQHADAKAAGKDLIFDGSRKSGQRADLSIFDARSLSAIVVNEGNQFKPEEVRGARDEIRARSSTALLAGLKQASNSADPTAFAKNIISAYGSMSGEERQAAGWSPSFYENVLSNYQTSARIAEMFGGSPGGSGGPMSLLNYL